MFHTVETLFNPTNRSQSNRVHIPIANLHAVRTISFTRQSATHLQSITNPQWALLIVNC
jgi:hypothetical protein